MKVRHLFHLFSWLRCSLYYTTQTGEEQRHLRIVAMNIDLMCCHLLQRENMDYHSVKDITSLCEELVKTPALLLVSFEDVCKDWSKQCLKTPETVFTELPGESTEPPKIQRKHKSRNSMAVWTRVVSRGSCIWMLSHCCSVVSVRPLPHLPPVLTVRGMVSSFSFSVHSL